LSLSLSLFTNYSPILLTLLYCSGSDKGINVRINAEDISSKLVEEHGLNEAYQVALKGAAEAVRTDDNYSLSVMREVKANLRGKIDEQVKASETQGS
jgi:hypothetical protein